MSKDYGFKIQSFAPDEKLKDRVSKMYMKQLKVFMKNKQVRNIAMTGDLGIGKSTLIRNYERKYPKSFSRKKYVYLSVTDMKVELGKKNLQAELEKRLLKQLLVICNKEEMIGSHYRPVPEKNVGAIPFIFAAAAILLIAWALGILPYASENMYHNLGTALLAAIPLLYLFYKLCKHYKLPSFEFNFGGEKNNGNAKAEHTEAEETLDKNITDIVYLMESIYKKSAKVLVVEDLDRYGADICIPIIEKLREINVLVNQRIRFLHGDKEPFRFVYILKDDIFSEMQSDKTNSSVPPSKYFDGILPVIPQLGHANSANYLEKKWKYIIEPDFIYDISKYFYDYRQIRAIENEFNVFRFVADEDFHFLGFESLDHKVRPLGHIVHTELMAFCIYKHFYPQEYYKIRTQPNQELVRYLIEKTINNISTEFPDFLQLSEIDLQYPNDERKKILFKRISINILRYIFPDNDINNIVDMFYKLNMSLIKNNLSCPSIEEIEETMSLLNNKDSYTVEFQKVFSMYMVLYITKIKDNETIKYILNYQKNVWETCDETEQDNKYFFVISYALSIYKATSNHNLFNKLEYALKIKEEILNVEKYKNREIITIYGGTLVSVSIASNYNDIIRISDLYYKDILTKNEYKTNEILVEWYLTLLFLAANKSQYGIDEPEIKNRLKKGGYEEKYNEVKQKAYEMYEEKSKSPSTPTP